MMGLCFELTNYAFQLATFICCCYKNRMELDGVFWSKEDRGCICWSFLLAKNEKRYGAICCTLHYMSKS
jgi:hypothetical protein